MARKRPPLPTEPQRGRALRLDARGRGVVMVGERAVHVAGALPGELVEYRYLRRARRYDEALVVTVHEAAPDRGEVRCRHFNVCGGCSIQHVGHQQQLLDKDRGLLDALDAAGSPRPDEQLAPLRSPAWCYRRRARLAVRDVPAKGGVLVGFREKTGNRVAEMTECPVMIEAVGTRVGALRSLVGGLSVRDAIPQIEVAAGDDRVALVVRHLAPMTPCDRRLLTEFAHRTRLQIYLQPGGLDSVAALEPEHTERLRYRLDEFAVELEFEPTDFIQVNPVVNRALVSLVCALLAPRPGERILDLFCGIGNFSLPLARSGAEVLGVDGDEVLIGRAGANAARNAVATARFEVCDLHQHTSAIEALLRPAPSGVLLDPPRSGAAALIGALADPYPARIVYVSCNPESLARDAAQLVNRHGYRLTRAGMVDMFPHTNHVEAITVFERGGAMRPGSAHG